MAQLPNRQSIAMPQSTTTQTVAPVAVVTGSSSGIGKATAIQLARNGFDVVVHAATRIDQAEHTVTQIQAMGRQAKVIQCDFLAVTDQFTGFSAEAFAWRNRVDCWVNNAGGDVLTGERSKLEFHEKLDYLFQVDVRSTLLISRAVAARMLSQNSADGDSIPSVINIGWDQAVTGIPGDSGQIFSCTKGAIMALTTSLAKTYAPRIRFNCVAPGWIQTQWGQQTDPKWTELVSQQSTMKRWGQPEDVAAAIAYLASPTSSFINGHCLPVNGGLTSTSSELEQRLLGTHSSQHDPRSSDPST